MRKGAPQREARICSVHERRRISGDSPQEVWKSIVSDSTVQVGRLWTGNSQGTDVLANKYIRGHEPSLVPSEIHIKIMKLINCIVPQIK